MPSADDMDDESDEPGPEYNVQPETKNIKALNVHWLIDKKPVTDPESVFFAFPLNLEKYKFNLDLNGINAVPNEDQLSGSSKDWYPMHRYVNVSDGSKGITMASLDAPLLNLSLIHI